MYRRIFNRSLVELSEADLQSLVEREVSEGLYLDYKLELPRKKGERKEVAEGAAAFANAYGGYLIYGVREEEGVAREIVGLKDLDPDKAVSALENAIRDLTEPTVEVHAVPIKLASGRFALVVEVPRSLNAPHMADGRFYRRAGRSSAPMGYMDIRRAFAERGDAIRKLRERLRAWILDFDKNRGPVDWGDLPSFFIYAVSIPAFDAGLARVFGPKDRAIVDRLALISGGVATTRFFAEGLVAQQTQTECRTFSLLTPEGELFQGLGPLSPCIARETGTQGAKADLWVHDLQTELIEQLSFNLPRMAGVGLPPPYYVALALSRAWGYRLFFEGRGDPPKGMSANPVRRAILLFDQVLLEEDAAIVSQQVNQYAGREIQERIWRERAARLSPILDRLYQAAGAEQSPIAHALDEGM